MRTTRLLVGACLAVVVAASALGLTQPADRVFEMRTYTVPVGEVKALLKLFSEASVTVFRRYKITSVAYWRPRDVPGFSKGQARLVAVFAYPTVEAGRASWDAVAADSEWQAAVKTANLHMTSVAVYLDPTDFSPVK